tara:strand:+ start:611 stop:1045 length:435 start_codon:yes stop_codon:yes gene_type:complete
MKSIVCSGALFYTLETKRFLFLHRTQSKQNNVWGIVGGTNKETETPWEGLLREIEEEIGIVPHIVKTLPLETFVSGDNHFHFHTYLCLVNKEFMPQLNNEHNGYAWVEFNNWPKPLHKGVISTLKSKVNKDKLENMFNSFDILV